MVSNLHLARTISRHSELFCIVGKCPLAKDFIIVMYNSLLSLSPDDSHIPLPPICFIGTNDVINSHKEFPPTSTHGNFGRGILIGKKGLNKTGVTFVITAPRFVN